MNEFLTGTLIILVSVLINQLIEYLKRRSIRLKSYYKIHFTRILKEVVNPIRTRLPYLYHPEYLLRAGNNIVDTDLPSEDNNNDYTSFKAHFPVLRLIILDFQGTQVYCRVVHCRE